MQTVFLVGAIISLILMMLVLFVGLVIFRMKKENKVAKRLIIAVGVISIIAYIVCAIGFDLPTPYADYEYQQNLERKQEQKYELLSLEYSEELQSWTTSGEKDGIYLLLYKNESYNTEGEVTYKETYQFYYTKNPNTGEVGRMELDAETTKIFLIENDETPYLMETVVQQYEINYNIDPPVTTTYGDKIITYSLHIPKGSIAGDINITE